LKREARLAVEQMLTGKELQSPGALATEIFDHHGLKIGELANESRYFVGVDLMPQYLLKAFVAAEDADFFKHNGVSLRAIARAAWANAVNGKIVQGGSTITQQLARLAFLDNSQTLKRKFREAAVALTLDATLPKKRILELYLNRIYLGNQSYGVESAARNYFRKSVADLNIAECALLAGLAAAPSSYAPNRHWSKAKARQRIVLRRMQEEGYLTEEQRQTWERTEVKVMSDPIGRNIAAPYFLTEIRAQMERMFELGDLGKKGLKVQTTLDLNIQNQIRRAVPLALRKHFGDHADRPDMQIAALVIDSRTGAIVAMQGGSSFEATQYNHALRAERPLGSLFMPIYYALAMERGFSMLSSLYTQGEMVTNDLEVKANADLSLFEGLVGAKAVESSRLVAWLGTGTVVQQAEEFGLPTEVRDLSLALGRNRGSLMNAVGAFAAFHNGGFRIQPYAIHSVKNSHLKPLYTHKVSRQAVVGKEAAFLIRETMGAATVNGAARGGRLSNARVYGFVGVDQSLHDGWYIGAVGNWVAGVWVGSDRGRFKLKRDAGELQKAVGQAWAELIGPAIQKQDEHSLPPHEVYFTRLNFQRGNLGMQTVPMRLRDDMQAF
jgi:penicillin-binding protein 1A